MLAFVGTSNKFRVPPSQGPKLYAFVARPNSTIPIASSVAKSWAFSHIQALESCVNQNSAHSEFDTSSYQQSVSPELVLKLVFPGFFFRPSHDFALLPTPKPALWIRRLQISRQAMPRRTSAIG
jgi:hypothetical protein